MSDITLGALGTILLGIYSPANISQILSTNPIFRHFQNQAEVIRVNEEWSVRKFGQEIRYVHHCPCGDFRVLPQKTCHLCRAEVPEGVEFIARVLSEES